jgi:hypothetical protein
MKILVLAFVLALAACSFRSERTVQNPPPAATTTTTTGTTTVTTPAAPATATTVYTR